VKDVPYLADYINLYILWCPKQAVDPVSQAQTQNTMYLDDFADMILDKIEREIQYEMKYAGKIQPRDVEKTKSLAVLHDGTIRLGSVKFGPEVVAELVPSGEDSYRLRICYSEDGIGYCESSLIPVTITRWRLPSVTVKEDISVSGLLHRVLHGYNTNIRAWLKDPGQGALWVPAALGIIFRLFGLSNVRIMEDGREIRGTYGGGVEVDIVRQDNWFLFRIAKEKREAVSVRVALSSPLNLFILSSLKRYFSALFETVKNKVVVSDAQLMRDLVSVLASVAEDKCDTIELGSLMEARLDSCNISTPDGRTVKSIRVTPFYHGGKYTIEVDVEASGVLGIRSANVDMPLKPTAEVIRELVPGDDTSFGLFTRYVIGSFVAENEDSYRNALRNLANEIINAAIRAVAKAEPEAKSQSEAK